MCQLFFLGIQYPAREPVCTTLPEEPANCNTLSYEPALLETVLIEAQEAAHQMSYGSTPARSAVETACSMWSLIAEWHSINTCSKESGCAAYPHQKTPSWSPWCSPSAIVLQPWGVHTSPKINPLGSNIHWQNTLWPLAQHWTLCLGYSSYYTCLWCTGISRLPDDAHQLQPHWQ